MFLHVDWFHLGNSMSNILPAPTADSLSCSYIQKNNSMKNKCNEYFVPVALVIRFVLGSVVVNKTKIQNI